MFVRLEFVGFVFFGRVVVIRAQFENLALRFQTEYWHFTPPNFLLKCQVVAHDYWLQQFIDLAIFFLP